jgi:transcriptional regulator with XRE-family HTH domain
MATQGDHGGTDIGRRIEEERAKAGLSREETAARAGMAPDYLAYLETSLTPNPTHATLTRLAAALGVPLGTLTGAGLDLPPGQHSADRRAALEELTDDECRTLIAPGGIGRFLFVADRGPVATPVNYAMLGSDVVFRTDGRTAEAGAVGQEKVSFDVDHFDDALSEGWSVLVSGSATILTRTEDLQAAQSLHIEPWAGGQRTTYVRLAPAEITGRRIRVRATGDVPR